MSGSGSSHRSSMHKVFIDGAAGTTGLEIAERLAGRAEFELLALDDAKRKDSAARREAQYGADVAGATAVSAAAAAPNTPRLKRTPSFMM